MDNHTAMLHVTATLVWALLEFCTTRVIPLTPTMEETALQAVKLATRTVR